MFASTKNEEMEYDVVVPSTLKTRNGTQIKPGDLRRHCGGLGKEILMPYPINQRAHQFNSIQCVPVSFGLWDTALKFLSPGPRSDVTDHLEAVVRLDL